MRNVIGAIRHRRNASATTMPGLSPAHSRAGQTLDAPHYQASSTTLRKMCAVSLRFGVLLRDCIAQRSALQSLVCGPDAFLEAVHGSQASSLI
ncbi:hypothetical protein KM539_04730 [Xanthomonas translucens pv. poae]|uniref:hypothetical protein n=1 Tax=Xanthomonas graminis TaxID=3390026 RepID=UPI001113023B|nr:hypothetical protein [Xanthomonas translucens]UKE62806.1 hypothetical protein KM539_04730 [Xanthomonas translucens pv. poae]